MTDGARRSRIPVLGGAVVGAVAFFGAGLWASTYFFPPPSAWTDRFAAVSAVFGAIAAIGVVAAIFLQMEELALQRNELSLTRRELEGQRAELNAQNRTMSRDVFERCFFEMLRLNRLCVESLTALFPEGRNHVSGLHAFRQAEALVVEHTRFEFAPPLPPHERAQLMATEFSRYCLAPASDFAHYFRNLYHLFAFIDRSSLEPHEKGTYARIVRAQLSNAELVLLFANAQTEVGRPFVEYITGYALLKVVRWPNRFKAYLDLLPAEAYGGAGLTRRAADGGACNDERRRG